MITIKKKAKTPNMVWDAEKGKPLCKFVKGVIETNDEELAGKLEAMGHVVTGEADKAEVEETAEAEEEKPVVTKSKK